MCKRRSRRTPTVLYLWPNNRFLSQRSTVSHHTQRLEAASLDIIMSLKRNGASNNYTFMQFFPVFTSCLCGVFLDPNRPARLQGRSGSAETVFIDLAERVVFTLIFYLFLAHSDQIRLLIQMSTIAVAFVVSQASPRSQNLESARGGWIVETQNTQ